MLTMTPITDQQIEQIAAELQTGMLCYLNTKTGEIIFVPNEDLVYDTKGWEEAFKKLDTDFNFREIEKPNSKEQFIIMEDFVLGLPDDKLKLELLDVLDDEKPFRNFRKAIDKSHLRNEWLAFNSQKLMQWIKEEVQFILERAGDGA